MALARAGSYGHRVTRMGDDWFRLTWRVDFKHGRIRFPRLYSRDTDEAGAIRFTKRWKVPAERGWPRGSVA